jgi:protein required for attachment to host cells
MRTWILLADAGSARLYETTSGLSGWTLVREFSHPESRHRTSELLSDKPGRVRQYTGQRSTMEPPTPRKKVEVEKFARELARALEEGVNKNAFERLFLVTPPAFLGVLRGKLAPRVEARVAEAIEKDYLHLDEQKLKERLEEHLHHPG